MIARRIAFPILALLVSAVAPGNRPRTPAPMLPEIKLHLDNAQSCLVSGKTREAVAHCDVVLVSTEIAVAWDLTLVPNNQRAACQKAVDYATEAWENALDGNVKFRIVDDKSTAQVVVVFKPEVLLKGEAVAGLLNWKRTIQRDENSVYFGKFHSEMLIRTQMPDGRSMPNDALRHTVTHEMGHVFGLEDTSTVGELMGPLNLSNPLEGPAAHEIDAVKSVRNQAQDIRSQAERHLQ